MIRSYISLAIRHLAKRKFLSAVNTLGLAVGMTFTWLIASFVVSELLVNNTLRHAENQYIVRSKWEQPSMGFEDATVAPLGKLLKDEYPALVANYYRFDVATTAVSVGGKHFVREVVEVGDPTMLSMYGFPMLCGDEKTALKEPNSAVITEENAIKYFGKTDVLGRVLRLSNYAGSEQDFTVTGVLKSLPQNSVTYLWDQPVHIFIPLNSLQGRTDTDGWATRNMVTYVELQDGITESDLTKPIQQLLTTHAPKDIQGNLHPYLTPLPDYYRQFNKGIVQKTIYTLSGIALFVLFMAVVNFVNITIVDSSARIREIGVRKALGSQRWQVVVQLLVESTVLTALATMTSLLFYEAFRASFADVVGKRIDPLWAASAYFLVTVTLFSLLIGFVAGAYSAVKLSALPPVDSLRGKLKSVKEGVLFRRLLVTAQFTVALLVFCGAVVIAQQVAYFFSKDMGYRKESVLLVSVPRDWSPQGVVKMERVRDELARLPEVKAISITSSTLKGGTGYDINLYPVGNDSTESIAASVLQTDEYFVQTYQIPLIAGRFFQSSAKADQEDKLVLNEAAIRLLGYKNAEAAIGKQLYTYGYEKPITILGVTKDFSFRSLKEKTPPTAISHIKGAGNLFSYMSIKLNGSDIAQATAAIEQRFHQLLPDAPFEYYFADQALQQLYLAELQLKKAAQTATFLSLFIVLIGIVGLVSLSVTRRTKELAIRKVLGASVSRLVGLFIGEFFSAFLVAALLAFPIAFLLMRTWLQTFAYHVDISWFSFALIGLLFFTVVSLVVSLQTVKAALMNPVKSLWTD